MISGVSHITIDREEALMTDIDSFKPQEICFVISPIGEPTADTRTWSDKVLTPFISGTFT